MLIKNFLKKQLSGQHRETKQGWGRGMIVLSDIFKPLLRAYLLFYEPHRNSLVQSG